jgi:hypothetical protein
MIEIILFLIVSFVAIIFFLLFFGLIIGLISLLKQNRQTSINQTQDEVSQIIERTVDNSMNDSEGDGLILFDDPMFPPEFDDD